VTERILQALAYLVTLQRALDVQTQARVTEYASMCRVREAWRRKR